MSNTIQIPAGWIVTHTNYNNTPGLQIEIPFALNVKRSVVNKVWRALEREGWQWGGFGFNNETCCEELFFVKG